jgi:cytochrome c-type biogenesis protein CcmF
MVIHPPVLFLGFASTTIPFGFAVAGLLKKKHDWMDSCLPWATFSAGILGLGIMMGAAWAYESLTFGGYWAWDPVENASLVPWLTLVSAIHGCIIYRKTGSSLKLTYLFFGISFLLVLYSTFLTRSGILGDTSVHAFTDLGMNAQLLGFLLIFVIPYFVLFFVRFKHMAEPQKEEAIDSREFWMLIGSLILFLSAVVIISITSIPVFNKIFGTKIAPPEDAAFAHNQVQVFVAIIIGLLTATGFAVTIGSAITITIGAGGAGAYSFYIVGASGSNSVFSAVTATGGGGGGAAGSGNGSYPSVGSVIAPGSGGSGIVIVRYRYD